MTLSVATAAEGFTTLAGVASAVAFHAVTAVSGVQLVGLAKRVRARRLEPATAMAEGA